MNSKVMELGIIPEARIEFTDEEMKEIFNLARKFAAAKKEEVLHKKDGFGEFNRWVVGIMGELAVQKYLGIEFFDDTVGDSKNYARPDLEKAGYNVGVKTSAYPHFPLVNRNIKEPQIFVIVNRPKQKAIVLGIADMELLRDNLNDSFNDSLVYNKIVLQRKTAFSKIECLTPLKCLEEIEKYKIA